jgi:tRNA(fMet)-specific endonuclease VapC
VTYILDTDVFTLAELPDTPQYLRLHARILQLDSNDKIVTTIVTYEEQTRGWLAYAAKSRDTEHQIKAYRRLKRHLQNYREFEILDFDSAAGAEYDRMRAQRIGVGAGDLKIAAISLSRKATLLSRNTKDFKKVPGLRVEDWTGA